MVREETRTIIFAFVRPDNEFQVISGQKSLGDIWSKRQPHPSL